MCLIIILIKRRKDWSDRQKNLKENDSDAIIRIIIEIGVSAGFFGST